MPIVTISQPRYLPACNYIHRMVLSDIFVYLDNVKYSPRDWENRNKIKLNNGKASWLSVPVFHEHSNQLIKDTKINNETNWAHKHLNTLLYNYAKAKYFDRYIDFFKDIYSRTWEYLTDLNICIIDYIIKQLGLSCRFIRASEMDVNGKGQNLLIDICSKVGGDIYLSGPMGSNYIDNKTFETNEIKLVFHDYVHPVYPQIYGEFLPWMTFADLLFNCGDESIYYLNKENITKSQIQKG
jgi:hypothetical protein